MVGKGPIILEVKIDVEEAEDNKFKLSFTTTFTAEELLAFMDDFRFRAEETISTSRSTA